MNRRHWPTVMAGGVVVAALAAAFVLTQSGAGQVPATKTGAVLRQSNGLAAVTLPGNDAAPAVPPAIAPAPAAPRSGEAAPPGPGVEGIKVSGHWTIEVRAPDGRLVSHNEFENALQTQGRESLARFLSRNATPGIFTIILWGSVLSEEPCLSSGSPVHCVITESADLDNLSYLFKTLQVTLTPDNQKVRLSGTATAQRNGVIGAVDTSVLRCASGIAPSNPCVSGASRILTYKELQPTIPVLLNQQVVVSVEIGFN